MKIKNTPILLENFVAIDFETANKHYSSVCSVGIVIVKNGEIVERIYRLICPFPEFYFYYNTKIHGIKLKDTVSQPTFKEVWKDISPLIAGLPLVAHNSLFEGGCLKACFKHYKMSYPNYLIHCTCKAAQKALPDLENHKLNTVSTHCGFDLTNHHHALADAEACAHIALKLFSSPKIKPNENFG